MVRGNNENKKGQQAIAKQQLELEQRRIDAESARDKSGERQAELYLRASSEQVAAVRFLADEMKLLRSDQRLDLDDVRAGVLAIPAKITTAIQDARKPLDEKLNKEHEELLTTTRASQQLLTAQVEAIGGVANRVKDLPTKAELQEILKEDLKAVEAVLTKLSNMEATITEATTPVVLLYDKLSRLVTSNSTVPPTPAPEATP